MPSPGNGLTSQNRRYIYIVSGKWFHISRCLCTIVLISAIFSGKRRMSLHLRRFVLGKRVTSLNVSASLDSHLHKFPRHFPLRLCEILSKSEERFTPLRASVLSASTSSILIGIYVSRTRLPSSELSLSASTHLCIYVHQKMVT